MAAGSRLDSGLTPLSEHLATVLKNGQTAGQFKVSFRKLYDALAPYTKPEPVAIQTTGLRTVSSLKPKYHCVSCPEVCLNTERKAHTKKTGHGFCMFILGAFDQHSATNIHLDMESRNRFLYCESCADLVYDHGLERLCGPQAKFECQHGSFP